MDGTFNVAPLSVNSAVCDSYTIRRVSCDYGYAFLLNKYQSTYEELFSAIQDRCTELGFQANPTTITLDFQQAVINAVMSSFGPQVNLHGCFYHLTQATWRKIQTLGLVQRYREEEVKLFCGMLDGLTFLPVDDVPEGMTYLGNTHQKNSNLSWTTLTTPMCPEHPHGTSIPLLLRGDQEPITYATDGTTPLKS